MAAKLAFIFVLALIGWEYIQVEAMRDTPSLMGFHTRGSMRNIHRSIMAPPPPPPRPAPQMDPWRMSLPQPFQDDPPTIDESMDLFDQGLKRDPCTDYCAEGVTKSEIDKDCGEMVAAIAFLAENKHPRIKPECATAREHGCQYAVFQGYSCKFKVTLSRDGCIFGCEKEARYRLRDCIAGSA